MQTGLRMIAVLLLGAIFAALPGAQAAAAIPGAPAGHPAGCHSHRPAVPSPASTRYQCCVNGHGAAIPNASFSSRPLDARLLVLGGDEQLHAGFASDRHSVMFVVPSNSPPAAAPLRI
jgi:hypothetical protein